MINTNFATDKNGNVIKSYSKQGWDADIDFVKDIMLPILRILSQQGYKNIIFL